MEKNTMEKKNTIEILYVRNVFYKIINPMLLDLTRVFWVELVKENKTMPISQLLLFEKK
jgi:hypothetical protein